MGPMASGTGLHPPPSPQGPSTHSPAPGPFAIPAAWSGMLRSSCSRQPWGARRVCARAGGVPTHPPGLGRDQPLPDCRDPMGSEVWGETSQGLEGSRALQLNWCQKHWGAVQGHHRSPATLAGLVTPPNTTHLLLAESSLPRRQGACLHRPTACPHSGQ